MDGSPAGAGRSYVLDTRPLLNFAYTDHISLLEVLLGKPLYVPAQVHREFIGARSALERKLRQFPPYRHDPIDLQLVANLQVAGRQFRGNPFRVLKLQGEERDLALELERDHRWIDPGEAEVLAICLQRGRDWVAILDDRPAHEFAVAQGVPTLGTIELLIRSVEQGILILKDGEHLLDEMLQSWPRAPRGRLEDYLSGRRAVW